MKILVLSNMYPSIDHPSYGVFVKNFVHDIEKEGAEVTLSVITGKSNNAFSKLLVYLRFVIGSCYKILTSNYDLIYVHYIAHSLIPVILLRWFIKKPIILNGHGEDVKLNKKAEKYLEKIGRKTIIQSSLIIVPSVHFEKIITNRYGQLNTYVSPSGGFNTSIFYPLKKTIEKSSRFHIGYISRIDSGKGWDTLLKAIDYLKEHDIHVYGTLIGNGDHVDELRELIIDLELDKYVSYLGAKNQEELGDYFRSFDVFVFPTSLDESLGLVGIESMACGTPVIGSNIPSINSYLNQNENGLLFEPGNHLDLARKIQKYVNLSNSIKQEFQLKAIESSEPFRNDIVSNKIFHQLLKVIQN